MMKRIFHPIGQGAFYSEQFENINVVYDCGVLHNPKIANTVVQQSFKNTDVIDILFISHFDDDHINKIKVLKNHCKSIKNVVLPLLHEDKRILLVNIYTAAGCKDAADLVKDPKVFFGNDTNIIFVKPSEIQKKDIGEELSIENGSDKTIESKTPITSSKIPDWVYIPFNYEYPINYKYPTRTALLETEIQNAGLDIDKIKTDLDYAIKYRSKIKVAYNSVGGDINENSMLVYSGPPNSGSGYWLKTIQYNCSSCLCWGENTFVGYKEPNRVACIYSGDSDFNIVNIQAEFQNYWDMVGTVQIPHHGAVSDFNTNFFDGKSYLCPLSAGKNNEHGHPSSSVIADIFANNSFPFVISECAKSRFIQIISK